MVYQFDDISVSPPPGTVQTGAPTLLAYARFEISPLYLLSRRSRHLYVNKIVYTKVHLRK